MSGLGEMVQAGATMCQAANHTPGAFSLVPHMLAHGPLVSSKSQNTSFSLLCFKDHLKKILLVLKT